MNRHKRLQQLREKMSAAGADFYFVPAADAHRNEYVPACWQRRAWISGFTGSAGDALIGQDHAYLWTDGRYFLQAKMQLDPNDFQLMKQQKGTPSIDEWLKTQAAGKTLAVDPQLITLQHVEKWQAALESVNGQLIFNESNWIDALRPDQPSVPCEPIENLDLQYTGEDTTKKLARLRTALAEQAANAIVLTRLDAIAWLFNIRGKDIDYNPLTISFAMVTQETATLFIDPKKISDDNRSYFETHHIQLKNYDAFQSALQAFNGNVCLDPQSTSAWTAEQLKKASILKGDSPITLMKACKNKTEQAGMREAHRIDAIALIQFLHWLEKNWKDGVTEISAADQLEHYRRKDPRCRDLSFATISGFASNGAIIHYSADKNSNKTIDASSLYLLDSGGQYREGTTDVTRTLHLGEPTQQQKQHYTLVLKGHIHLRHAVFPEGTTGEQLDPLARGPIQDAGYDYSHGTGHGVGCYLCVHEGPQMISPRPSGVALQVGMAVSNEPGLYFENQYGIRIENVCLVTEAESPKAQKNTPYYTFEDLTLVPYARKLIERSLLDANEIRWINEYHQRIYDQLHNEISDELRHWLKKATESL